MTFYLQILNPIVLNLMNEEYKILKEKFLKNDIGQSLLEVHHLSLIMPFTILYYYIFFQNQKREINLKNIMEELFFLVLPYSILFIYFNEFNLLFAILFYIMPLIYVTFNRKAFPFLSEEKVNELNLKKKSFIDSYRFSSIMGTSLTILMVDFPKSFPNRYYFINEKVFKNKFIRAINDGLWSWNIYIFKFFFIFCIKKTTIINNKI
jgi:hypothetical protein